MQTLFASLLAVVTMAINAQSWKTTLPRYGIVQYTLRLQWIGVVEVAAVGAHGSAV